LKNCRLYVVIDQRTTEGRDLIKIARKAIIGGADLIQLRFSKETLARYILKIAFKIKGVAEKSGCLFIINDRVDIAHAVDADGVHLGQEDIAVKSARSILKVNKIIGISTHNLLQAVHAERQGADYISVGPVFRTPTKKEYRPVGLKLLNRVSKRIKIPFFAIGGINHDNIDSVIAAGAERIAVVRAAIAARNVQKATQKLKRKLLRPDFVEGPQ
jgi:thiamine-phosphate pyrophosphorylase